MIGEDNHNTTQHCTNSTPHMKTQHIPRHKTCHTTQHNTPKHNKVTHNNTKQHNPHETKMKILVSDKITENAGTEYNESLLR